MILFFRTPQQSVIAVECKHDMVAADSDKLCWLFGEATPESEENCAIMAVDELKNYVLRGNIKNSVNFPTVCMPMNGACRICVLHKNVPNTVNSITSELSALGVNIANMQNASKRDWAYTVLDIDSDVEESILDKISAIADVVRARLIK